MLVPSQAPLSPYSWVIHCRDGISVGLGDHDPGNTCF